MRHIFVTPQSSSSPLRSALIGLALALSACGQMDAPQETNTSPGAQTNALLDDPCTLTENSPAPTLSPSGDVTLYHQCGDPWVIPTVTAVDACGNPLQVHRYNTGDDDGDGIPGSTDPDDFGPGPDFTTPGIYYLQYLAWDSAYNITGVVYTVVVDPACSCTVTEYSPNPTMTPSADVTLNHQCGDPWVIPTVTAADACGNPLAVHRYNTGDDDGDGIPGSIDPDDFGPGPDINTEGTYFLQYLAWDPAFNISGIVYTVNVVNCP